MNLPRSEPAAPSAPVAVPPVLDPFPPALPAPREPVAALPPGPPPGPPPRTFFRSRWLFMRGLALVYVLAFSSALAELPGLFGPSGLLPVGERLRMLGAHLGPGALLAMPSLVWLNPGYALLESLCLGGLAAAVLLFWNAAPRIAAGLCWLLYLSLVTVGGEFYNYQWDALLLEAGFLAIFLGPGGLRPGIYRRAPASWSFLWLGRLLLAKLLLGSALVKLLSGDAAWHNWTALSFHFETQPLPTPLAWWFHHLPPVLLQGVSCALITLEVLAPLLIFGPRRIAHWTAAGLFVWFGLISLSGNHAFMNVLAMLLCLLLVDDRAWAAWSRRGRERERKRPHPAAMWAMARHRAWPGVLAHGAVGAAIGLLSLLAGLRPVLPATWTREGPAGALLNVVGPFRTFNSYGMFATVTRTRREIVIEGTLDGRHWYPYPFRYKPGSVYVAPGFVAPWTPRLDWQMWFAALEPFAREAWFDRLLDRLLAGDPNVLDLFARDPFPLWPPRQVRAVLYEYHFTSPEERRRTGNWWWRKRVRLYAPPRGLDSEDRPPVLPHKVLRT